MVFSLLRACHCYRIKRNRTRQRASTFRTTKRTPHFAKSLTADRKRTNIGHTSIPPSPFLWKEEKEGGNNNNNLNNVDNSSIVND